MVCSFSACTSLFDFIIFDLTSAIANTTTRTIEQNTILGRTKTVPIHRFITSKSSNAHMCAYVLKAHGPGQHSVPSVHYGRFPFRVQNDTVSPPFEYTLPFKSDHQLFQGKWRWDSWEKHRRIFIWGFQSDLSLARAKRSMAWYPYNVSHPWHFEDMLMIPCP